MERARWQGLEGHSRDPASQEGLAGSRLVFSQKVEQFRFRGRPMRREAVFTHTHAPTGSAALSPQIRRQSDPVSVHT